MVARSVEIWCKSKHRIDFSYYASLFYHGLSTLVRHFQLVVAAFNKIGESGRTQEENADEASEDVESTVLVVCEIGRTQEENKDVDAAIEVEDDTSFESSNEDIMLFVDVPKLRVEGLIDIIVGIFIVCSEEGIADSERGINVVSVIDDTSSDCSTIDRSS